MPSDVMLEGALGALGALIAVAVVIGSLRLLDWMLTGLYDWVTRDRDTEKPRRSEWSFARDTWNTKEDE